MITSPIVTYTLHGLLGILLAVVLTSIGTAFGLSLFFSLLGAVAIAGLAVWLSIVFYTEPSGE